MSTLKSGGFDDMHDPRNSNGFYSWAENSNLVLLTACLQRGFSVVLETYADRNIKDENNISFGLTESCITKIFHSQPLAKHVRNVKSILGKLHMAFWNFVYTFIKLYSNTVWLKDVDLKQCKQISFQ